MDSLDERCLLSAHVVTHLDQAVRAAVGVGRAPALSAFTIATCQGETVRLVLVLVRAAFNVRSLFVPFQAASVIAHGASKRGKTDRGRTARCIKLHT